jgi:LysM repeat protein
MICTACDRGLPTDEEVNRELERGRRYRSQHLYAKAEEAFLGVLQKRPRDARAHQELGYLYFEDLTDYISALYHLERYRKLRPMPQTNDLRSDVLEQVLAICQQEIAKGVSLSVLTTALQHEIESLREENRTLQQRVVDLTQQITRAESGPNFPRSNPATNTTPVGTRVNGFVEGSTSAPTQAVMLPLRQGLASQVAPPPGTAVRPRTHTIRRGDTLYSLAGRYGLTVQQLQQANPRLRADNLQIGQTIVIPEP